MNILPPIYDRMATKIATFSYITYKISYPHCMQIVKTHSQDPTYFIWINKAQHLNNRIQKL